MCFCWLCPQNQNLKQVRNKTLNLTKKSKSTIMHGLIPPVIFVLRLCLINYVHIVDLPPTPGAKGWTFSWDLEGRGVGKEEDN